MIERINSQSGFRALLFQTAQAALAEIPRKLSAGSRQISAAKPLRLHSWQRSIESEPYSWLFERRGTAQDRLTIIPGGAETKSADDGLNPRHWLTNNNPRLGHLVSETIGDRWITHAEDLQQLAPIADRPFFQSRWQQVKRANKQALASHLYRLQGIEIDVNSLFDLQLQPIASEQRQLLNILHIITLFNRIKANPDLDLVPRTFIFGDAGSADAVTGGSQEDRVILLLIKSLAKLLATDPDVNGRLQVVYVSQATELREQLYSAADLTEQIAMAELEDLDLSKFKFAANGVLSIGSLGQGNQIVQQAVGADNYFYFGLAIPEIFLFKEYGYDPYNYYKYYPEIRQAIDGLLAGKFTPEYPSACRGMIDNLLGADENMVLADYIFYLTCQAQVSATYRQQSVWTRMSILNVAGLG